MLGRLGQTAHVSVTVRSEFGTEMTDQPVRLSSANPSIATVSPSRSMTAEITAVSNGVTSIRADIGSLFDTMVVIVDDPIAAEYVPDREALIALFEQSGGDSWTRKDGWGFRFVPMKDWYGITVSYDSTVNKLRPERIELPENNLIGKRVPKEIGQLTHLKILNLERSSWGGFINSGQRELKECLPWPSRHWPLCDTHHSTLPKEIMKLQRLDSLELGWGGCVPVADTTLLEWVRDRELYSISHPLVPNRFYVRKTSACLHPGDIKEMTIDMAQAVSLGDSLIIGRDTWIAARPVRHGRTWAIDSTTVHRELVTTWPEVTAAVCVDEICKDFDMMQRSPDTITYMRRYEEGVIWTPLVERGAFDAGWRSGFAVGKIPGELVKPGMTITFELSSRTVGDIVQLLEYQFEPIVFPERSEFPVTLVGVVPPTPECRSVVLAGGSVPDDCHEWPDSSFADYHRLRDDPQAWDAALFDRLKHWFPVEGVDVQWHDEFIYTRPWDRVHDLVDEGRDDLRQLDVMRRDARSDRYWVGVVCLIGHCGWLGLGGVAYQNGRAAVAIPNASVIAHEIGHNLGLSHPDETEGVSASIDAVAIGKWRKREGEWRRWEGYEYVDVPVHPSSNTFMHSLRSNTADREGEGIAPWQLRHVATRLVSSVPALSQIVVVN